MARPVAILHPRGGGWFSYAVRVLRQRGIQFCDLTRNSEWPTGPELLAFSTVHSAKGLEFDHVLMPGLSDEVTPHGEEDGDGTLDTLRRLIAMGRGTWEKDSETRVQTRGKVHGVRLDRPRNVQSD